MQEHPLDVLDAQLGDNVWREDAATEGPAENIGKLLVQTACTLPKQGTLHSQFAARGERTILATRYGDHLPEKNANPFRHIWRILLLALASDFVCVEEAHEVFAACAYEHSSWQPARVLISP